MITPDVHRRRILDAVTPLGARRAALSEARGRALAEDVRSRWPVPLFDASAMDGYAVRAADAAVGAVLRVIADLPAGSDADPVLGAGETARIMTGAPVPRSADAVVPLEDTDLGVEVRTTPPRAVTVLRAPRRGAHIRHAGEDVSAGEVVVPAGTELTAWRLSAIASCGAEEAMVHTAPRVAVISTGSELVPPSATPRRGQIPESNSILLRAAVTDAGAIVSMHSVVQDDAEALRDLLRTAVASSDAVILTGGASVGSFDVVKAVLAGEGVRFDEIAMRPGKPQGFGVIDGCAVFCLPGSPVGMAVSFEMFVRPALRRLAGFAQIERRTITMPASESWRSPAGRVQLVPVVFDGEGVRQASSGAPHGLTSLATADALVVVPAEIERIDVGDAVSVMSL